METNGQERKTAITVFLGCHNKEGKEMKAKNLRKSLIVLLTSLFMVLTAFAIGLSGAFSVKAEDYKPTESEFYMLDGAQVAQVGNYGMRFTTKISRDYYDKLDAIGDVRFYTTIGPLGFTPAVDNWTEKLTFDEKGEATIYGVITYGSLTDAQLKEKAAVELTAKAYAEVTPDNGDEVFTIAAVRNDTTRSMRAVANMSLLDDRSTDDKDVLSKYLGNVIREEEVQDITNRNTVVNFDRKVSGRVFLNGVRTNLFVNNKNSVDIKEYLSLGKVDLNSDIVVSVMGENGYSVYDVVSKVVTYGISFIYKDANGNPVTDYNIITGAIDQNYDNNMYNYVPARYMLEFLDQAVSAPIMTSDGTQMTLKTEKGWKTELGRYPTYEDKFIVIGTASDLFLNSGLPYDKREYANGKFTIATKGNCIFLYGGDQTSKTTANYGNMYAVFEFLNQYFNLEIVGNVPTPVGDYINENLVGHKLYGRSFSYSYGESVYSIDKNVTDVTVKTGVYTYEPDINERSGNYGTYNADLQRALRTNGNQSETIMSAYGVTYEEYLKIADAGLLNKRMWTGSCGHIQYSATMPTECSNADCTVEGVTFIDTTNTVDAYKRVGAYACQTCAYITVSFGTPTQCTANYDRAVNGNAQRTCSGKTFQSVTSASWHTAGHAFPIRNYAEKHMDWFGDDAVYACNSCKATHYYYDYHDVNNGGEVKAEANRKCSKGCGGTVTKYYGSKETVYACDSETCGATATASEVGKYCSVCESGIVTYYEESTSPSLYGKIRIGDDRVPNKMQPCYLAHGNESEYKLMVAEGAKKVLNNVKYVDKDRPDENVFAFSDIDGTSHCECDACVKSYIKYGTMSGAQVQFCNDVCRFVEAWMEEDTSYISNWLGGGDVSSWWKVYDSESKSYVKITDMTAYQRPIVVHFFAYMGGSAKSTSGDRAAPVKWDGEKGAWVGLDESVEMYKGDYMSSGVYLVTSADAIKKIPKTNAKGEYLDANGNVVTDLSKVAFYTYDEIKNNQFVYNGVDTIFKYLTESGTSNVRDYMTKWGNLSGDTPMYLWVNTQSSNYTTLPFYSANLLDQYFLSFMSEMGVETLFMYASAAESNAVTAFNNLKLYVSAKRMWDVDADLEELFDTWFNTVFIDPELVSQMREIFNMEMTMSVKANFLHANSEEHVDYDQENFTFLGNNQAYTALYGPMGEYWDVEQLVELHKKFKAADARLEAFKVALSEVEYLKVRSMLYIEWYSPLVSIMRYYQNDPAVIPYRAEMVAKFQEIIELTGIKYNAEYGPPTCPTARMIYYTTKLEVVIFDFTSSSLSDAAVAKLSNSETYIMAKDSSGNYVKDINGDGVKEIIYDISTGELNLFEGERYRILLRTTEDLTDESGAVVYPAGTYIVQNSSYFGYNSKVSAGASGRYTQEWPTYYSLSKGACVVTTGEGYSQSFYNYSTKSAFLTPAEREALYPTHPVGVKDTHEIVKQTIAGKTRTVAKHCDELNIHVGMGVTNWAQETVYTIAINIISK